MLDFALETGELKGLLTSQPEAIQQDTILEFMIAEAVKTSEIEGEFFSIQNIVSSVFVNSQSNMMTEIVPDVQ